MDPHTIERFEKGWMLLAATLVLVLIGVTLSNVVQAAVPAVDMHHHTLKSVNPQDLSSTPFATPGLKQNEMGQYELYMLAQAFMFNPPVVKVPAGKPIQLFVTSTDVVHGLQIENTNINIEVIPGVVGQVTYTFKKPGVYRVGCNEYCGVGHQSMMTQLIVEETP
ncbi:cytochrome c oxidase subunit II [Deinococcus roseus]|uniref:Cytochrome c oxidase subunit 2 n=1 Tax=Deinococcus roseus TaxID=392414 RepID=A0ABQ2D1Z3_9DEIO|nr:cytochrome c oxidase subunit II [Deinococcus roseus]GGJ42580.1 cytochrome c oxidase subunit 2 [Deinococcus roseus]